MKKIPTLFQRDPDDRRFVMGVLTPGCEWVLAGEGVPTRKYDGTCVLVRRDGMAVHGFGRRIVKPGKPTPPGFVAVEYDAVTGNVVGWEPIAQSGFARYFDQAVRQWHDGVEKTSLVPGTYELCGPKINGNPEGYPFHVLRPHALAEELNLGLVFPLTVAELWTWATYRPAEWWTLHGRRFEGIVWHHPDGRMAKLKARDLFR